MGIGGGDIGSGSMGDGGGADGIEYYLINITSSPGTYKILVGGGGNGGAANNITGPNGQKGTSTKLMEKNFNELEFYGGEGGVGYEHMDSSERDGGSGGGGYFIGS